MSAVDLFMNAGRAGIAVTHEPRPGHNVAEDGEGEAGKRQACDYLAALPRSLVLQPLGHGIKHLLLAAHLQAKPSV
jgi:hypothetical protein